MDLRSLLPFAKKRQSEEAAPGKPRLATAGYQAYHTWAWQQIRDLPLFNFAIIHQMLLDGEVRLALATRAAPIQGVQFAFRQGDKWIPGVKARRPEVGAFVLRQFEKLWADYIADILTAQEFGWAAGEVTLKLSAYKLVEFEHFEIRHATDCRLLKRDGHPIGVRFDRVMNEGHVDLEFPRAFFHAHKAPPGDDYGQSAMIGAYSPWWDKCAQGGALDVRRLFMHKDAYGGVTIGYPSDGDIYIANQEQPVPARDIARQIAEQVQSGGVLTKPSDRDENGNEKWTIDRAQIPNNPQHILEYPKDLDSEIRRGIGVPDQIIDNEGSGSWAGARIPMAAFYASLDVWVRSIIRDFCEQVVDRLIVLNFGRLEEYEITHKPLAEQAMEQQANAGPGQNKPGMPSPPQAGLPGQPGESMPQQQSQQTQQPLARMSLDPVTAVGEGVLSAAKLVEAANHVLAMSVDRKDGGRWITVHPNGDEHEGRPVLIDKDGRVQAGMGAKNKGNRIGEKDSKPRGIEQVHESKAKAALASGFVWKENKSGMLAWFKGDSQFSGAIDKEGPHYDERSAENMASTISGLETLEDLARKEDEFEKANDKNYDESHAKWKNHSIEQLNYMKQHAVDVSKEHSDREFNKNGGRRSGPAMLNQGAREAAETAAELDRYINERIKREHSSGDKKPDFSVERFNKDTQKVETLNFNKGDFVDTIMGENGQKNRGKIVGVQDGGKKIIVEHPKHSDWNNTYRMTYTPGEVYLYGQFLPKEETKKKSGVSVSRVIDAVNKKNAPDDGWSDDDRVPEPTNPQPNPRKPKK